MATCNLNEAVTIGVLAAELTQFGTIAAATLVARALRSGPFIACLQDVDEADAAIRTAGREVGLSKVVVHPMHGQEEIYVVCLCFADNAGSHDAATSLDVVSDALVSICARSSLERQNALLLEALEQASDGVIITEADQLEYPGPRIVYANRAITESTGFCKEELLGLSPRIFQSAETDPASLQDIRTALWDGRSCAVSLRNRRKDGTPTFIELEIAPVRISGVHTHFVSVERDISARAEREARQREQDDLFKALFAENPAPMWVFDPETAKFLEVNQAATDAYGWSREQFLNMTLFDVRPQAEWPRLQEHRKRDRPINSESEPWIHQTATGEQRKIRAAVRTVAYQGLQAKLAVIWDMTELENARDEVKRRAEKLQNTASALQFKTAELLAAQNVAKVGSWRFEFSTGRVFWSDEAFHILGRDLDFRVDKVSVALCVHPDDRDIMRAQFRTIRDGRHESQVEYRVVRPDGSERVIASIARPTVDDDGKLTGVLGIIQDVTERKLAEDGVLQAEKLRILGQVTGGIAHDFNNLLTVITLNLGSALSDFEIPETLRNLLSSANHATKRSAELTSQLLSYARRRALSVAIADPSDILDQSRKLLSRTLGGLHHLVLSEEPDVGAIQVDAAELENAIFNIVINARDAMPRGGPIRLSLRKLVVESLRSTVPDALPPGRYVVVKIADEGCGIPKHLLDRIFEPFFTTKDLGKGTGLGLSAVYGFVRQSHGFMTVETSERGTTFEMVFPASEVTVTKTRGRSRGQQKLVAGSYALLVEDDELVRNSVERQLQKLGFTVNSVGTGAEALERLQMGERTDLLLTDINLPAGFSGFDVAAAAQQMLPGLRVLLSSGDPGHTADPGPNAKLLPKPYRLEQLAEILVEFGF